MPAARKGFRMLNIDRSKILLMGGIGATVYNDLKEYDYSLKKWSSFSNMNQDVFFIPEPRFGHTLNIWGNNVVCLGGNGDKIPKLRARKSFSDLRIMDLQTLEWIQADFSKDGKHDAMKRVNHAAAVLGDMLIIHGGLNSDENYLYPNVEIFDLTNKKWLTAD